MKKVMIMAALLLSGMAYGQNVTKDAAGNFHAIKTEARVQDPGKPMGKTYTDSKGKKYPVYVSKTGKMFVLRTSAKSGKEYRQYLKL
jgi:hypothetical protein